MAVLRRRDRDQVLERDQPIRFGEEAGCFFFEIGRHVLLLSEEDMRRIAEATDGGQGG